MLILYSIVFVLFVVGIFISVSFLFSLQDINLSQHVYLNKLTKSHNSWKTCSIPKSIFYGHLQDMLVIVCGYKQNPSRGGGVVHTRLFPYMLYIKKMTKSHNSSKTCSIQNPIFTVIFMWCWSLCVSMNKIAHNILGCKNGWTDVRTSKCKSKCPPYFRKF